MNNISYWKDRLMSEGVDYSLVEEFTKTVKDIMFAKAIDVNKMDTQNIFDIIDLFGDDDDDSEKIRRYLYYIVGEMNCSDSYAYALAVEESVDIELGESIILTAMKYNEY